MPVTYNDILSHFYIISVKIYFIILLVNKDLK